MKSKIRTKAKHDKMLLKFYISSMLTNAMFYLPTLVYFFSTKIVNPLNVSILISLKSITTFIFEVPTGFIADKYGRKVSIVIGLIINIISLFFLIIGNTFIYFAIAQCLFGLAETFRSGSDIAFLYDNLKYRNETDKFEQATQKNYMYVSITVVVSYIIGGYIYEVYDKLPFIGTLVLLILALLIFSTLEEHPYKTKAEEHLSIGESIRYLKSQSNDVWPFLLFGNILIGICISTYVYYAPLLLSSYGLSGKYFGFIFSFGILAGAICAKFTHKIKKKEVFLSSITPLFICIVCLVSLLFDLRISAIFFVITLRLIWGLFSVIYTIVINNYVSESSIRATLISIGNGVVGLASVINTLVVGFLIKYLAIKIALIYLILVMLLIMILFNTFVQKAKALEGIRDV